jgi:hypothetical protein
LENKAVDFQISTIRDGKKNKRISFFSATPRLKPAETKQAPKKQGEKKRQEKKRRKSESRTSNALQPHKRE